MNTHECNTCHAKFDLSYVDVTPSTHEEHRKVTGHDLKLVEVKK